MKGPVTVAVLRKRPGNCSGAAQAARCIAYTVQCHPNVETIRNYEVVGIVLQTDWVDFTVAGGEHRREPLASADAANNFPSGAAQAARQL